MIVCFYLIFLAITILVVEENEEVWCDIEQKWKRAVLLFTPCLMLAVVGLKFFVEKAVELLNRKRRKKRKKVLNKIIEHGIKMLLTEKN